MTSASVRRGASSRRYTAPLTLRVTGRTACPSPRDAVAAWPSRHTVVTTGHPVVAVPKPFKNFRRVIPWRVAWTIDSSKHPGRRDRSRTPLAHVGNRIFKTIFYSYREQFPCHLPWRHGALPGRRCMWIWRPVPSPRGEGSSEKRGGEAMSPSYLCQHERAWLLKMKGMVVTPTPQAERSGSASSTPYALPHAVADGRIAAQSLPARR
jgi:hypothetical protein